MNPKSSSTWCTDEEEEVFMQGRLVLVGWHLKGSAFSDAREFASLAIVSSLDLTKKWLLSEENILIVTATQNPEVQAVIWMGSYIDMNSDSYGTVADLGKAHRSCQQLPDMFQCSEIGPFLASTVELLEDNQTGKPRACAILGGPGVGKNFNSHGSASQTMRRAITTNDTLEYA